MTGTVDWAQALAAMRLSGSVPGVVDVVEGESFATVLGRLPASHRLVGTAVVADSLVLRLAYRPDLESMVVALGAVGHKVGESLLIEVPFGAAGRLESVLAALEVDVDFELEVAILNDRHASELTSGLGLERVAASGTFDWPRLERMDAALVVQLVGELSAVKTGGRRSELLAVRGRSGEPTQIHRGVVVQVPRKHVSDGGAVSVTGHTAVETGLKLELLGVLEQNLFEALDLSGTVTVSSLRELTADGAPLTDEARVVVAARLPLDGAFYRVARVTLSTSDVTERGFGFSRTRAETGGSFSVWVRFVQ